MAALRWHCQKADLKLIFDARIGIGEELTSSDGPIDNLLDAHSKHAGEKLLCSNATVD
jgi:hypothetical protein